MAGRSTRAARSRSLWFVVGLGSAVLCGLAAVVAVWLPSEDSGAANEVPSGVAPTVALATGAAPTPSAGYGGPADGRGSVLSGALVDARGRPVGGALVALVDDRAATARVACPCEGLVGLRLLEGRCSCPASAEALRDLVATQESAVSDPRQVRSDGEGRFSLRAPSEAAVALLFVDAEGFFPHLEAVAPKAGLRIVLFRPRALRGVVSVAGVPALGASVEVLPSAASPCRWRDDGRAAVDGEGRFAFEGLACTEYVVRAALGSLRDEVAALAFESDAPGREVELALGASARLRVRIVDARGGGAVLGCVLEVRGAARRPIETSDEGGGVFTAPRLTAGAHRVEASCPGGGVAAALVMVPESGEASVELGVGAELTGLVVDAAGRPVAGAQVRASQQGLGDLGVVVGTDPSGRFRFERLSAARYRVEAQHAQYASVALEVVLPLATEVLLAFSEQAALEVSVTGPAGEAVAGATVTARRPSQGTLLASGTSDESGRVTLRPVEPGPAELEIVHAVHRPMVLPSLTLTAGTQRVSAVLEGGLLIEGRVEDERGSPLGEAIVDCSPLELNGPAPECYGIASADGRFTLSGLSPGRYTVRAARHGAGAGRGGTGAVTVEAGTTTVRIIVTTR